MISLSILGSNLFVHEIFHFLVGALISFIVYKKFRNPRLVVLVFLVSFFIDADHYFEGIIYNKFNLKNVLNFYPGYYWKITDKMTLLFHDWEALFVIFVLFQKTKHWPFALAIILAAFGHYFFDQLIYSFLSGMSIFEYSFIYRAIHHFRFSELCRGC